MVQYQYVTWDHAGVEPEAALRALIVEERLHLHKTALKIFLATKSSSYSL